MDPQTESLLNDVISWFQNSKTLMAISHPGYPVSTFDDPINKIDSTIRTLCTDGDPDAAGVVVDRYLNYAYNLFTTNTSGGIQDVKDKLDGWTGDAARQFKEHYVPDMCDAVTNYLNMVQGMVAVFSSYQGLLQKVRTAATTYLQTVKAQQEQMDQANEAQQKQISWAVVDCVVAAVGGIVAGPEVTLIGVLSTTAKGVVDTVNSTSSLSGAMDPASLLKSSLDGVQELQDATNVEISKLNAMMDDLVQRNTEHNGFQVSVPSPEVVTDGADPTKFTDHG